MLQRQRYCTEFSARLEARQSQREWIICQPPWFRTEWQTAQDCRWSRSSVFFRFCQNEKIFVPKNFRALRARFPQKMPFLHENCPRNNGFSPPQAKIFTILLSQKRFSFHFSSNFLKIPENPWKYFQHDLKNFAQNEKIWKIFHFKWKKKHCLGHFQIGYSVRKKGL